MRTIAIEMIETDMILAKDIWNGGILLLKKGTINLHKHIKYFKNLGIKYIYVEDEKSYNIVIPEVISEYTKESSKSILMNTMDSLIQNKNSSFENFKNSVQNIINDVSQNKSIQISLTDVRTTDEYTFSHCISTTVYALLMAKKLNYNQETLEMIAMGTLLHDIGKILLNGSILFKKEPLTKGEMNHIKEHVVGGYELLKQSSDLPEMAKRIVLLHHERLDGSGYPFGYKGEQLHEIIKIVSIADVYDALTSDRCYRKKWSAYQAVNYLMANSGSMFDTELVSLFIRQIAVYPNGSVVRLSDGRTALVKEQNQNYPLRPIVRVFSDKYGNIIPIEEIDLMEVLSITITESELEIVNK